MSEEVKAPVADVPATETPVAPAPEEVKPVEPTTETAEEVKPTEETTEEAKPTEETPAKEEVKPVYSGSLGYATSTVGAIVPPKYHFYFGGEEPVAGENLKGFAAKQKEDVSHALAWSSQTGKGLLYYVKDVALKEKPSGVIPLSEVDDVSSKGKSGFTFKTSGTTHTLKASSPTERDGWLAAFKEKVDEAKAMKEDIVSSDTYKEHADKWGKGTAGLLAASAAGTAAHAKKSFDGRKPRSESTDKERKERSLSRGKLFSGFRSSSKKEVPAAAPTEETAAEEAPAVPEPVEEAAPVVPEAPIEATEPAAEPTAEAPAAEETPAAVKASRRGSKFYLDKLRGIASPTKEKKLDDVVPPTGEAPVAETAPVIPAETINTEEPAIAPALEETKAEEAVPEAAATEETKPDIKERRRSSFFANIRSKVPAGKKGKEATTPEAPAAEVAEEPAVAEPAPEAPAPVEEAAAPAETTEAAAPAETPKEPAPKKENPLKGLTRNLSKAIRGKKAKPTEKVEETEPAVAEEPAATEEAAPEAAAAHPEPTSAEPKAAEPEPVSAPEPVVPASSATVTAAA